MAAVAGAFLQLGQHYDHSVNIADGLVTLGGFAECDLNQNPLFDYFDGVAPVGASGGFAAAAKLPSTHAASTILCKRIESIFSNTIEWDVSKQ